MTDFQESSQQPDLARVHQVLSETRAKLEDIHRQRTEPIAILGAACRLPGGANTLELYWQLLREGRDAMREVPPERWDIDEFYDPTPGTPGKMYVREGGYLDDLGGIDPDLFHRMPELLGDHRQRLLLEVVWEALERSGLAADRLPRSTAGVFLSLGPEEYEGSPGGSFAAGRISNFLGLEGPCLHVDTACSSTLVGLHLASQALRSGECDLAIVGGISLVLSPANPIQRCACCMFAPDARCRAFDASAAGSAQGEGCVVLILKRGSDARASGDPVMALIRGTATNHDGASSCLGVPNKQAQISLMRTALENARLKPEEVHYVEAHASGSAISDALELESMAAVYGVGREQPLLLGSVKSNFGNLEAAAGAAAVLKVALCLQQGSLAPHLHFQEPSPFFSWSEYPLRVNDQLSSWPDSSGPRRAGVSTFSVTGSNAHVLMEQAPSRSHSEDSEARYLFVLSARSADSIEELARRYSSWLLEHPGVHLGDLCHTVQTGRVHHPRRLAYLVSSREELLTSLAEASHSTSVEPGLGFSFAGDFADVDWVRTLYRAAPPFRRGLDQNETIRDRLLANEVDSQGRLLLSWALWRLWKSLGLEPAFVLGRGQGEYTAAVVAGVLDLEEALTLCKLSGGAERTEWAASLRLRAPKLPIYSGSLASRVDELVQQSSYWEKVPASVGVPLEPPHLELSAGFDFLESLRSVYLAGADLEWSGLYRRGVRQKLVLPTYPFRQERLEGVAVGRPEYVEPQTSLQRLVAVLWEELLECPRVGLYDDFFTLGGTSLLAAQMIRRLQDYLEFPISLSLILECVTLEGLTGRLLELHGSKLEKVAEVWLHVRRLNEDETQRELESLE